MNDIIIGKHTLESLTSGMYSDPFVVFREYIQNAADSLDEAERLNINRPGQGKIDICLSPTERRICILDNGTGVAANTAEKTLISIGNSKKRSDYARGFRGIGRLAALSYCSSLTFETSCFGEKMGTRISIDSKLLSKLLMADSEYDISIVDVLNKVYTIEQYPEKENDHYFNVYLDGVDATSGLNNYEDVVSYISQNAPVPYDPNEFDWGKEIVSRLRKEGVVIRSYNVSITYGYETKPIYKPYHNEFLVDKGKQLKDTIKDIEIIQFRDANKELYAIGWIAQTNYLGSIYDKSVKGIRLRKGNILIGDNQTLNTIFKDARFNGWSIGEVFVITPKLVPNARRDNFEKNSAYFLLIENLSVVSGSIAKSIRSASLARNQELASAIKKSEEIQKDAFVELEKGIRSAKKGSIKQHLTAMQVELTNACAGSDAEAYYREIAFEELDMLIGRLNGATSFKAINTIPHLSKTEKQVLEKVFNIIIATDQVHADKMIDAILSGFMR